MAQATMVRLVATSPDKIWRAAEIDDAGVARVLVQKWTTIKYEAGPAWHVVEVLEGGAVALAAALVEDYRRVGAAASWTCKDWMFRDGIGLPERGPSGLGALAARMGAVKLEGPTYNAASRGER